MDCGLVASALLVVVVVEGSIITVCPLALIDGNWQEQVDIHGLRVVSESVSERTKSYNRERELVDTVYDKKRRRRRSVVGVVENVLLDVKAGWLAR